MTSNSFCLLVTGNHLDSSKLKPLCIELFIAVCMNPFVLRFLQDISKGKVKAIRCALMAFLF